MSDVGYYIRCQKPFVRKYLIPLLAIFSLLWFGGCQPFFEYRDKEEMKKAVLEKDAAFSTVLEAKAKVDEQIKALKTEFRDKNKLINEEISGLREKLQSAKKYMDSRIKEIDSQLNPHREELNLKIKKLITELKLKESSLSATKRTVVNFTKLAQQDRSSKGKTQETPELENKISSLKVQVQELEQEVSTLHDEVRINRLKLRLLD